MPIVQWSETYRVNNELIDAQHQRLFDAINDLYDAVSCDNVDSDRIGACVKFLTEATEHHFADEERLMRENNYPLLAKHQAEHKTLLEQLTEFDAMLCRSSIKVRSVDEALVKFLAGEWLLNHVADADLRYIPYISK
jgi:hemerythrin